MSNIPTAEEFLKEHYEVHVKNHFINFSHKENEKETYAEYAKKNPLKKLEDTMIEFAKLHCEAQLNAIIANAEVKEYFSNPYDPESLSHIINEDSIINAYPLENIK